MRRWRLTTLLVAVAVVVLATDIVTKVAAVANLSGRPPVRLLGGALYLSLTRNTGAAWNLGAGYTAVLAVVAVVVIIVIIRFSRRLGSRPWAVALGLVLGGASGNLVDRLFRAPAPLRGGVVDFLSLFGPYGRPWPIFNVADSCLVCGVLIAVFLELTGRRLSGGRTTRNAPAPAPDEAAEPGDPPDFAARRASSARNGGRDPEEPVDAEGQEASDARTGTGGSAGRDAGDATGGPGKRGGRTDARPGVPDEAVTTEDGAGRREATGS